MSLYVLIHRPGPGWQAGVDFTEQDGIMDHIRFMRRMDDERRMLLGGPFDDEWVGNETTPVGMAIIQAGSDEEAQAMADSDASVQSGLLSVTVRAWRPRMGSVLPQD
jgi:uncharacterized protein YciI